MRRLAVPQQKREGPRHVWSIGIYAGPSPLELTDAPGVANPVLTRDAVSDVPAAFVADPFMLKKADRWHMFFEVMNVSTHKGEIGHAVSEDGLRWIYDGIVLAETFHLSYPYVFEWMGEYYMIPESFQAGAVQLYRARRFPRDWVIEQILIEGAALVDGSIFRVHGRWWLFLQSSPLPRHDTLRLYSSAALEGPWTEHPQSPVVRGDERIARPAGRVVIDGARIFRFAQDCRQVYGRAVRAFEVTELTAETYEERQVGDDPLMSGAGRGWKEHGMHHVDASRVDRASWIACVDGWFDENARSASRIS
jgi:hypothetical protein